jgi:hypothetical protein
MGCHQIDAHSACLRAQQKHLQHVPQPTCQHVQVQGLRCHQVDALLHCHQV